MSKTSSYRDHWPLIVVLASVTMVDIMAVDMYLPALPQVAHSLSAPAALVQGTLSIFLFGLAIGQLIYGPLLDRYGRRLPLLGGILLYASGSLLAALAPSIEVLLLARLMQAVGAAAGVVVPRTVVSDLFPQREAAVVYSVLGQIQMLVPVAAPLLGVLILQWSGWRTLFWVLLVATLLVWLACYRTVPDSLPRERRVALSPRRIGRSYLGLLGNRPFMLYTVASAVLFGSLFSFLSLSPFVIMEGYGYTPVQYSLIFGSVALLVIGAGALNIRLLPVWGARTLLLAGLCLQILAALVLCVCAAFHLGSVPYLVALGFSMAAIGLMFGNLVALTMARAGPQAGSASAVMGFIQYGGGAVLGSVASGFGTTALVLGLAFVLCAIVALALCRLVPAPAVVDLPLQAT